MLFLAAKEDFGCQHCFVDTVKDMQEPDAVPGHGFTVPFVDFGIWRLNLVEYCLTSNPLLCSPHSHLVCLQLLAHPSLCPGLRLPHLPQELP